MLQKLIPTENRPGFFHSFRRGKGSGLFRIFRYIVNRLDHGSWIFDVRTGEECLFRVSTEKEKNANRGKKSFGFLGGGKDMECFSFL